MPECFQHYFQSTYCSLYSLQSSTLYGDGVYLQYRITIAIRIFRIHKNGLISVVVCLFPLVQNIEMLGCNGCVLLACFCLK